MVYKYWKERKLRQKATIKIKIIPIKQLREQFIKMT